MIRQRLALHKAWKSLSELTNDEKRLLQMYYLKKTKTMLLDPGSGIVRGLEIAGILFRTSELGGYSVDVSGLAFSYNVTDWAWKKINENPEIIAT
jgi:hypothetical protein